MKSHEMNGRALVLGGGGVAGVAWELGILTGLYEAGVDLRAADLVIGTSAGSTVGAQITSGTALDRLLAFQLVPPEQTKERAVAFDQNQMLEVFGQAVKEAGSDPRAFRARIGAYALAASTAPEAERLAIVAARLPVPTWPQQRLLIIAVDTATGEEYIMDRESGVSLAEAVAASCAVPGVWPPVTIAGHRYMDGGVRSAANADLASGSALVLILNPLGANANFFGTGIDKDVANLEREGSKVLLIGPDEASSAAIGMNPLDPATRKPCALAGQAQGRELVKAVAAFWS